MSPSNFYASAIHAISVTVLSNVMELYINKEMNSVYQLIKCKSNELFTIFSVLYKVRKGEAKFN